MLRFARCTLELTTSFFLQILSERSKLSIFALNLVEVLALNAKEGLRSSSGTYLSPVLKLSSRAERVYVILSRATLINALKRSACHSFIPRLCEGQSSPSRSLRETVAAGILTLRRNCKKEDLKSHRQNIEKFINMTSVGPSQKVRECSKFV